MMANIHTKLNISEKFRRLVQPITGDELSCLEKEVSRKGSAKIFVFNGIIVDGYEEYEIAVKLGYPIESISIPADNFNEAVIWLCRTQLKRSDLTLMMRKYLIGRISLAEQSRGSPELNTVSDMSSACLKHIKTPTRMKLAKEYNYSFSSVCDYEACAKTIDMLFSFDRETAANLLVGKTYIVQSDLIAFARLSIDQLKNKMKKQSSDMCIVKEATTIKTTPKYDPDAEISSLSLTVPSWINMIERVGKNVTPQITERAADEIFEKLSVLKDAAENLIEQIMEVL